MTDKERRKIIKKKCSTPEGRFELAWAMMATVKCHGYECVDGKQYYRYGGKLYDKNEWEKAFRSMKEHEKS